MGSPISPAIEADAVVEPVRPVGEGGLDRPGIIGDAKEAQVLSEQRWHPKMRFGRHWFHDRPPASIIYFSLFVYVDSISAGLILT